MANALVCGGGFIGAACAQAFRAAGWSVLSAGRRAAALQGDSAAIEFVTGDFGDRTFARQVLSLRAFDRIVFAAGPADVQRSFEDPAADFEQQTLPLLNLLEEVRTLPQRPGLLLVSSAAVYGNPPDLPVREDTATKPISPYGFHKRHQELLLDEYLALYGLPVAKARVFSTFGPGLRHLAVWDVVRRAAHGQYGVWGTGRESRDYLFVHDVARALECVASASPFEGEVVNVASGRETEIAGLVEVIFAELGVHRTPVFSGDELCGSPRRWRADVSRLTGLGFAPQWTLGSGIRETVQWIRTCG